MGDLTLTLIKQLVRHRIIKQTLQVAFAVSECGTDILVKVAHIFVWESGLHDIRHLGLHNISQIMVIASFGDAVTMLHEATMFRKIAEVLLAN